VVQSTELRGTEVRCNDPANLEFLRAESSIGDAWENPVVAYKNGTPCSPSMAFGWDGIPYIAFHDEEMEEVLLTGAFFFGFESPQHVGFGINPSIAFDYDDGTVAIAYYDPLQQDLGVADGHWEW
jgi:hypothetical protein